MPIFPNWSYAFGAASWLLAAAALGATPTTPKAEYLLIVSIDGLPWDGFSRQPATMPTLQAMAREGASGPLSSVFPTMTWAAHASLWTGQLPLHHGIVGNRYFDRISQKWVEYAEKGAEALRSPTLADAAKAAGWSVGSIFWPNSGGATGITWNLPEAYRDKDFTHLTTPASRNLLEAIGLPAATLPRLASNETYTMDMATQEIAVHLVGKYKPRVLFVHFLSVDTASHTYGPTTAAVTWAMTSVDRNLAAVLAAYDRAGIGQSLVTFVVSDHGFAPMSRGLLVPTLLRSLRKSTGLAKLQLMANGHALYFYGVSTAADAQRLTPALLATDGIEKVITPSEYAGLGLPLPAKDPRSPDLIALARPDVLVWNGTDLQREGALSMLGAHGYLPSLPALQGILIARGPGIGVAKLSGARVIDVAPTAAKAVGLQLPGPIDGKVLEVAPAKNR